MSGTKRSFHSMSIFFRACRSDPDQQAIMNSPDDPALCNILNTNKAAYEVCVAMPIFAAIIRMNIKM